METWGCQGNKKFIEEIFEENMKKHIEKIDLGSYKLKTVKKK